MHRKMEKPRAFKVRFYSARLTKINWHLDVFPGLNPNNSDMELNEILLQIVLNVWGKKDFPQGFGFEIVPFKKSINILECMETVESDNEGVVEPSKKKLVLMFNK